MPTKRHRRKEDTFRCYAIRWAGLRAGLQFTRQGISISSISRTGMIHMLASVIDETLRCLPFMPYQGADTAFIGEIGRSLRIRHRDRTCDLTGIFGMTLVAMTMGGRGRVNDVGKRANDKTTSFLRQSKGNDRPAASKSCGSAESEPPDYRFFFALARTLFSNACDFI